MVAGVRVEAIGVARVVKPINPFVTTVDVVGLIGTLTRLADNSKHYFQHGERGARHRVRLEPTRALAATHRVMPDKSAQDWRP